MLIGPLYRRSLLRPLIETGQNLLATRSGLHLRARLGLRDAQISTWLKDCEFALRYLGVESEAVDEVLRRAGIGGDRQSLQAVLDLLKNLDKTELGRRAEYGPIDYHPLAVSTIPELATVEVRARVCFVIMPFDQKFRPTYENAIRRALSDTRCGSIRGDEIDCPGPITSQVFISIAQSHFCIADISGSSPNVMYELGIAHTLKKPTILITQDPPSAIPFDIRHFRCTGYEPDPRGLEELYSLLVRAINALLTS